MSLTALITIIYLVFVLAVGYITSRKKGGGVEEFFVAGRALPWVLLTPFLMAEYISSGTTVGVAERVHREGITVLMYYLAAPLGLCLLAFGFAKFYHQIKKVTIGETFKVLFDEKTRKAFAITTLILSTIGTGVASLGLGTALVPMFGVSYETAIWLAAVFLIVMALLGLRGQAWMNVIHLVGILVPFVVVAIAAVISVGGWGKLVAALPPQHLNFMRAGPATITAWITSSTLIKLISLIAITAMFAAKNEHDAKIAAVSTGFLVVAFTFLPAIMGLVAYVLAPGMESRHALWKTAEHLGEWATALTAIGVLAAIVSTTPASLLTLGAVFARDIILPLRPNTSEKQQILYCRLAVVFIGLVGTGLGILATGAAGGILGWSFKSVQARVIIVLPLMASVLWRRINATVAFWTIILGVGAGFIWLFAGSPFGVEVLWPSLGVALVVMVVGSLIAKPAHYKGVEGLALEATNPGGSH